MEHHSPAHLDNTLQLWIQNTFGAPSKAQIVMRQQHKFMTKLDFKAPSTAEIIAVATASEQIICLQLLGGQAQLDSAKLERL